MNNKKVIYLGEELANIVNTVRSYNQLGLRDCAKQIGISTATLCRIEQGKEPDINSLFLVCDYIKQPMNKFFKLEIKQ